MTKRSEEYIKGIPMKPYDLLKEGLIFLGVIVVLVVVLAAVMGAPTYWLGTAVFRIMVPHILMTQRVLRISSVSTLKTGLG